MTRRVLIISPHFPPINAADHQRVRMSLPYLESFGWKAVVLTVSPEYVSGVNDPLLLRTVPQHIDVVTTPALPIKLTQRFGLGTLGWRCLPYLARAGAELLRSQPFDLIYFSTTAFPTLSLAARWHRQFSIPYVIDFQDPWLSDYHKQNNISPPGGRLKYGLNQLFARWQEPQALRQVSQVISVSPEYPKVLCDRYPWLQPDQCSELPFGAPEKDFELLPSLGVEQNIFDPQDGFRHWVYVGRGGKDMATAVRLLFTGIQEMRTRSPSLWKPTKLHFIGTSYAPSNLAVETIKPIAIEVGIGDIVEERTQRLPYFEALKVLTDSDAILLIGSDDASYTASKLYPCILARRPILAAFHEKSSVVSILQRCNAGRAVTFNDETGNSLSSSSVKTGLKWLLSLPQGYVQSTDWAHFAPYTAQKMTKRQCKVFDRVVVQQPSK